jgi:hypothetical protein
MKASPSAGCPEEVNGSCVAERWARLIHHRSSDAMADFIKHKKDQDYEANTKVGFQPNRLPRL